MKENMHFYKQHVICFGFTAIVLGAMLPVVYKNNYIFLLLIYAALIFLTLFYFSSSGILIFILSARIIQDSFPQIAYPKLLLGFSMVEYFTLCLMIFMIVYLLLNNGLEFDAISKSMGAVLAAMVITTVYHLHFPDFINVGSLWIYFILSYIFFKFLLKDVQPQKILYIIVITSLYPLLNLFWAIAAGSGSTHAGYVRFSGSFLHVHHLSNYLFFAIPALLYLLLQESKPTVKFIYIILLIFFHYGIFMAGYRTVWIATIFFWSFYIMFISQKKLAGIFIALCIMLMYWKNMEPLFISRFAHLKIVLEDPVPLLNLENYQYNGLLSGRIGFWRIAIENYLSSNILSKFLGTGIQSTAQLNSTYLHNEYISALTETGIVGLSTLLFWIISTIKTTMQRFTQSREFGLIVIGTFFSLLIIAAGTMPFRDAIVMNYISIYFAILYNYKTRIVAHPWRSKKLITMQD